MSSYEDLMKTLLKEAIEKEKLEEEGLPRNDIEIASNTDIKGSASKRSKSMRNVRDKLSLDPNKKPSDSLKFLKDLKKLLKKTNPQKQLSADDINNSMNDEDLIRIALDVAAFTSDPDLAKEIRDLVATQYPNVQHTPSLATVDPYEKGSDIDLDKIQSLSFPSVMVSDANMNAGQFFGSQNDLINSIFSAGTIKERCEEFTKASDAVFNWHPKKEPLDKRRMMQNCMFVDLCNSYFNQIDSRAVGYSFESLCAIFCGGKVVGGGNGAADFVTNTGAEGSSKKYANWNEIKQSASGFSLTDTSKSKVLHYVIGMPSYENAHITEEAKMSDNNAKVSKIDLYYIVISLVDEKKVNVDNNKVKILGTFTTSDPEGNILSVQQMYLEKGNQVDIIKNASQDECLVGTFRLYSSGNSFKQILKSKMKNSDTEFKKAFKQVEEYFSAMKKADEETKKYINSSEDSDKVLNYGNSALSMMTKADSALESLLISLKPEGASGGIALGAGGERTISESKQLIDIIREMTENELKDIDFE